MLFGLASSKTDSNNYVGYITKSDLAGDGIHPTNAGYLKMAAVWNNAIIRAQNDQFLRNPENTGTPDDAPSKTCEKVPGQADGPHVIQKGYGFDDGTYRHKGTKIEDVKLSPRTE